MIIRVCRERAQMDRYWFGLAGWRRLPGWDGKGEQADMSSWVFGMNDIIVKTINSHFNSFIWRKYRNKLCTEEGYPLKVIYFSFNLFFIIHSIHTIWILWITLAWFVACLAEWKQKILFYKALLCDNLCFWNKWPVDDPCDILLIPHQSQTTMSTMSLTNWRMRWMPKLLDVTSPAWKCKWMEMPWVALQGEKDISKWMTMMLQRTSISPLSLG